MSKNESYRYERKFLISGLMRQEVESLVTLHPAMFSEIYHQRFINNIYLDSSDMRSYFDNVNGSQHRKKLRIRWYGDLFGAIEEPILELKTKDGLLGSKLSFALRPFSVDERNFRFDEIMNAVEGSDIADAIRAEFAFLEPVLINRYSRKYYMSADGDYRITIDSDVAFYRVNTHNRSLSHKLSDSTDTILELKYHQDRDYRAKRIASHFPFRMTKSSKYVSGIEKLYAW
ncbi:polyphosphate polymerase domain-containing protein [Candidatus Poribacteria bacterium]